MVDTGAQHSFINEKYLHHHNNIKFLPTPHQQFYMADGLSSFTVTGTVDLIIRLGDIETFISAFVTTNLCVNLILGMDYFLKYDIEIKPKKKCILFCFNDQTIVIPIGSNIKPIDIPDNLSNCLSSTMSTNQLTTIIPSTNSPLDQTISNLLKHLTDQTQHNLFQLLLLKFQSTFDTSKYTIAKTNLAHVIETYPHTPPVSKFYPGNPTINSEMRLIINKLLDAGLIRHSQSSYAAPALLIKKKDNTWRLVIDYKKLNSITIKDNYPLPNMEIILQTLAGGYNYFSKFDLKSGFWQLPIDEKDRFKTAFITPFGLYEWNVLPQGLRNAPPSFQRIMNNILSSCIDFTLIYLDDIIIFSKTYRDHLVHLEQVLNVLYLHNLILTPTKCEIAKQKIEYLGHMISSTSINPLPNRINAISLLPEPKSLSQANHFIGALSWYRKFLPNFASIAAPIFAVTNLSKAHRYKFKWGSEQSQSFHDLKQLLTTAPLFLSFPVDTHPILLSTDASKTGIGGILFQEIDNDKKILYYHSELLSSSQKRYDPIELEALAIFKCITRMKSLLLGRNIIIFTDNCPLCHMMDKSIANKRVEKISLLLQEFNIQKIIHVKGKYNCLPDYLSRNPIQHDDELLDFDYGLEFCRDKHSTSIELLGAVVTRSNSKALKANDIPSAQPTSSPSSQHLNYSDKPSSSLNNSTNSNDIITHFDITKIQEHQQRDHHIQNIINDLKQNPNLSFEFKDGILYKLQSNAYNKLKHKLIYVPSSMIQSLLISYHDNPFIGAHFAIKRTLNKLQQQFWWPNMKKSVIDHIKSCVSCQAYNVSRQKRPGFLQSVPPPDGPNQLLGMDFCGPFPTTPQSNKYVLSLTDHFTKYVVTIPLPVCTASATADALFKYYICHFGVPKTILSDQGTSFKNNLMHALSKLLGYHHIFSIPYHPQSNGQIERFNSTFVSQIAKLTDNELNNWDEYLHAITFAYNTGIHSSTNISPFELTFGRKPNLPTDHPPTTFTFPDSLDYLNDLMYNLKYYHVIAKQNIIQQQKHSKNRYDRHRHNPHYAPGTTVLTRIFTNKSKLSPQFSVDPKIIIKKAHPAYWVEDMKTKVISKIHVNDIRPLLLRSTT